MTNCPTCGQKVSVQSADEGTNSYSPEERNCALDEAAEACEQGGWWDDLESLDVSKELAHRIRALKEKEDD